MPAQDERVVLPPPLPLDIPNRAYLCHRGVDAPLAEALADDFRHVLDCEVIVQKDDGLSLSWPEFREAARQRLAEDCDFLIVLLNRNLSGPVYRRTLSVVENAKYDLPKGWTQVVRIDDCEGLSEEYRDVIDVTSDMTQEQRRAVIEQAQGRPMR